jgi:uridine kinase
VNVFVDAPADLRLIWRIRRDLADRGRSVEQVLHHDAGPVRAAYERYVRRRVPTPTTSSPTTARSRTRSSRSSLSYASGGFESLAGAGQP